MEQSLLMIRLMDSQTNFQSLKRLCFGKILIPFYLRTTFCLHQGSLETKSGAGLDCLSWFFSQDTRLVNEMLV